MLPTKFHGHRFLDNLQKFTQVSINDKRKIYNSKTIHAKILKFILELLLSKNSLPTKFHNFWITETQDTIQTTLHEFENTFQIPI